MIIYSFITWLSTPLLHYYLLLRNSSKQGEIII